MVCFFLGGKFGFECFCLFLFCVCLVRGEKVASAQDFGWQSKGEDHFRSWFPFSWLLGDNSVLFRYCLVQRPFCIFLFLPILDREFFFLFFAFSHSFIGNFLSFLCLLPFLVWEFSFLFVSSPFLGLGIFLLFVFSSEGKD